MECNKEEAIRAKEIAEKKMQGKDFVAARKIAQKAQLLFPELENISQMLAVCDIHCAAAVKVGGTEMDWYGILQVATNADEVTIKKQFRKLALLLHPDKNKYAEAEAAFKLIGQAHTVLLDSKKRWEHNMKRNIVAQTTVVKQQPPPSRKRSSTRSQNDSINNTMNTAYSSGSHQQKTVDTFWTMCPFCGLKYQYYRTILNRSLRCQNCMKTFVALDMNAQGGSAGVNSGFQQYYYNVPMKKDVPNQGPQNGCQQGDVRGSFNSGGFGVNFEAATGAQFSSRTGPPGTGVGNKSTENGFNNVDVLKNVAGRETAKPSGTGNKKKGRKVDVESSESCDTSSTDDEEINVECDNLSTHQNDEAIGSRYPRRSTRQKQQVAYREDESDDEEEDNEDESDNYSEDAHSDDVDFANFRSSKRPKSDTNRKMSVPNGDTGKSEGSEDGREVVHEAGLPNGSKREDKDPSKDDRTLDVSEAEDELDENVGGQKNSDVYNAEDKYDYPEPEFYDFDQDRTEEKFQVNQIWALYDDEDGMPRFYARIDKVDSSRFKLQFTWLEPRPALKDEKNWSKAELPFACGTFKLGDSETCENVSMFSYLVSWSEGTTRNTYRVCPRKGDVWAIFKHWDIKWSSDPEKHGSYNYEVVEVLSDYDESRGIEVAYLVKLKGFTSLFQRVTNDSFVIPSRESLRFSHKIPAYRLARKEKKPASEGSIELDPAAAPSELEEFDASYSFKHNGSKAQNELSGSQHDALHSKSQCEEKDSTSCSGKPNNFSQEASYERGTLPMENPGLKVYSPRKVSRTIRKETHFSR